MTYLTLLILLLPFINFLVLLAGQKKIKHGGGHFATATLLVTTGLAIVTAWQVLGGQPLYIDIHWFSLGTRSFKIDLYIDNLSALMMIVVTLVSALVHMFSLEYMKTDKNYNRYFAYLGLFTFSMLGIIIFHNLLIIYIFWELVGVSSYLLIGFWYEKKSATRASQKAFLVNRIGDVGFLAGILLVFNYFGDFNLLSIAQSPQFASLSVGVLLIIGLCLFCGAVGKSAQFPLQVWLPDAMEGPTPVSALIHAATMVAAGVYLLARIFFLLNLEALSVIATIGCITAFIGAFSALAQSDIKKVLAYSTISQLGYMVMGMGVGAYEASLLHLLTHAFFKACLFLCAGAVIHSMHQLEHKLNIHFDAQNMYLMGGLRKAMPFTFVCYVLSAAALAGLPFFSGFLSKDAILSGSLAWASFKGGGIWYLLPVFGFLSAFLTAFYMGRQLFLVFFGHLELEKVFAEARGALAKVKDVPLQMKIPLGVLALGALWLMVSLNPFDAESGALWQWLVPANKSKVIADSVFTELATSSHHVHGFTIAVSVILAFLGLGLAYALYRKHKVHPEYALLGTPALFHLSHHSLYIDKLYKNTVARFSLRLSHKSFAVDDLYDQVFTNGIVKFSGAVARWDKKVVDGVVNFAAKFYVVLAHIIAWIDKAIVDGFVHLLAYLAKFTGRISRSFQNGHIQSYYLWVVISLIALMLFLLVN
ncbi:NADH-quinone oxidoreductase subunit L [uncultured Microscilla sp.]|uniref:NADH-quinone oxidoreductase subunit L n=1 Tax=uncultured Microscilla sp. TaxID=432653 RepID=UPI00260E7488|nr:NADH-quinone oxidoreductase subunit L [uncultured Microscilla sp.]